MLFNGCALIFTFSGPKLELPRSSAYGPYLRRLCSGVEAHQPPRCDAAISHVKLPASADQLLSHYYSVFCVRVDCLLSFFPSIFSVTSVACYRDRLFLLEFHTVVMVFTEKIDIAKRVVGS